ncbi:Bug family tripartite tricarboxylate transporter substrate binding protein [Ramlibacter tataouinensis]|uniref:Bug family tripartite tricarboxylate transporter substrate binding protein n=1 Tax=Ramlibacter tataouinensis TaxID=94132 RepID=UPI0022F37EE4|nr:Bug family tripartite tricarboxylate transporter substrate binding protein [Ramlibacter tataouinensis]WBY01239.1 Bug family tripartite tricarboxylate transporter substrate binding protein [Ramlibacter tataouinensis]
MINRRQLACSVLAFASSCALAQAGPTTRLLVGFPAGSSVDGVARMVADEMRTTLNRSIVVENKPGAGGRIVMTETKRAAPDGSTLVLTPIGAMVMIPHTVKKLAYDPAADFTPIGRAASYGYVVTAGPMVPATTLKDALGWLKANPTRASFGSPGAGGAQHFAGVLLSQEAGVAMEHVAYKGSGPALTDLIGGNIALTIGTSTETLEHHRSGKVRILATTAGKRLRQLPDVPTLREAGLQMAPVEGWFGVYAPAGMPPAEVERWSGALKAALAKPAVQDKIRALGVEPDYASAAELGAQQAADYKRWEAPIKASGFTND